MLLPLKSGDLKLFLLFFSGESTLNWMTLPSLSAPNAPWTFSNDGKFVEAGENGFFSEVFTLPVYRYRSLFNVNSFDSVFKGFDNFLEELRFIYVMSVAEVYLFLWSNLRRWFKDAREGLFLAILTKF